MYGLSEKNKEGDIKVWSLEEIDALLSDSVSTSPSDAKDAEETQSEKERRLPKVGDDIIDSRSIHNANTQRNIKTTKIEHSPTGDVVPSSSALESDKYRERFINRRVRNLEKTEDHSGMFGIHPEKPIEKEGVIKRASNFKHTQDLAPLPTLVSPEDVLAEDALEQKTRVRGILDADEREKAAEIKPSTDTMSQIKIEGFDDSEEPIQKVDEDEVERELYEKRKEKAKSFQVNPSSMPEDEKDAVAFEGDDYTYTESPLKKETSKGTHSNESDEFRFSDDKIRFAYSLKKKEKSARTSLAVEVASLILILIICAIPLFGDGVSFRLFGGSERTFLIVCAVVAAVGIAAGYRTLKKGFFALTRLKPSAVSCAFFAVVVSVIQLIVLFIAQGTVFTSVPLYLAVGIAALVFYDAGELMKYKRANINFNFITKTNPLYSVESISDEEEAFEIGRGLLLGEPDIKASFRTLFPSGFMELSSKRFVSDELSSKMFPIILAFSAVVGIVVSVMHKDYLMGFGAFVAAFCIGMPASAYLADNVILSAISKNLTNSGAMISGYEAMENCLGTNAVALDSSEIFDASECNIYGIKTFHSMRIDEAILYTAAMIIEANGPLSGVFDKVILGRREILPPVETIAYEDKLGLSAWIHNRRVLVGNRDLLINHNVQTPTRDFEKKYLHDGRCALYLAIEGKIAAMFIVSYEGDTTLSPLIKNIEKNGVTLLVKTADANITEELVCSALKLPPSSTKVLSAVAGDIFEECRNEVRQSSQAHVLHDGSAYSMLKALCAVFSLGSFKNITMIMQAVGGAIGVAFTAVLALSAGLLQIGPLQIIIYQIFWAVLTVILLKLRNKH